MSHRFGRPRSRWRQYRPGAAPARSARYRTSRRHSGRVDFCYIRVSSREPVRIWEWCTALVLAWVGCTIVLTTSPFIMRILGLRALERLMGMLLVLLATQMLLNAIAKLARSLT
ncbi:MAG: MarC family protein [Pseudomonadales bacterium]|nr:MarC family protein [Pseudomonadales bacterium]MDP6472751.1 MarC family protein [Pseudomonadales bacterium]MDP6827964.1 MarC family protein [Pseudomonadales bacterium]MDP6971995.1 MarC family protein [Pseudomonadales bacterium]